MIREKGQPVRVKLAAIFVLLVLSLYPLRFTVTPTHAAESTPSADIKAKLEELKKEIASRAAKLKQEVTNKLKDKAYTGKVKTHSSTSITVASKNGPKIVNLNQDTVFESRIKNKKYGPNLISEEDYIASLGDVDETGVLTARKVILLPAPDDEVKTYLWGQIVSISDKLMTLKDKAGKNIAISISENVKVFDFVILTGFMGENAFEAEFVYVIPQSGALKPKKTATPSALPATKSATPKPISR